MAVGFDSGKKKRHQHRESVFRMHGDDMEISKRAGVEEPFMAEIAFTIRASLHQDYGGENFVHELLGKFAVRNTDDDTEQVAGELRAWLIQFVEAQSHGISPRVLADGH